MLYVAMVSLGISNLILLVKLDSYIEHYEVLWNMG